jgi:3-phenylpropionate/cinnamic acid dioxygenase small subunit
MDGLRIVSDGTTEGTHVYLDDREVREITGVTWKFSPKSRKSQVVIEISNVQIDAQSELSPAVRHAIESLPQMRQPTDR